jgi:hypothetical protein
LHPPKAFNPILVTEAGISIEVKNLQLLKEELPIDLINEGRMNDLK